MDPKRIAIGIFQLEPAAHRRADRDDVSIYAHNLLVNDLRLIEEFRYGERFISANRYVVSEAGPHNGNAVISGFHRDFGGLLTSGEQQESEQRESESFHQGAVEGG